MSGERYQLTAPCPFEIHVTWAEWDEIVEASRAPVPLERLRPFLTAEELVVVEPWFGPMQQRPPLVPHVETPPVRITRRGGSPVHQPVVEERS